MLQTSLQENTWQMGLFTDELKRKRSICLMETIDKINAMNHATELIHVAAVTNRGVDRYVRNENKSRLYTTDIKRYNNSKSNVTSI